MSDESDGSDREPGDDGSPGSDSPSDPSPATDDAPAGADSPEGGEESEGSEDADAPEDVAAPGSDDEPLSEDDGGEDPDATDPEADPDPSGDPFSEDDEGPSPGNDAESPPEDETGTLREVDDDEGDPGPDEPASRFEASAPEDEGEDDAADDDAWATHGFDARSPEEIREEAMGPDPGKVRPSEADPDTASVEDETDEEGPAPPSAAETTGMAPENAPSPGDPGPGAGLVTPEAEGETTEYDVPDPITPEEEQQPPDDQEMPLAAHIEEMIKRLAVVVAAVAVATAVAFPFATDVINAMWYGLLPPDTPAPHLYGPLEKILSEIKVASLAGILVALPVLVYESYLFMRPGLYPKERRYFLAAIPTSLILGAIGMAFAYFLILPVLFEYFILYSKSGVDKLAFGLQVTFDLIVALLGAFAMVFQIPLLIMLAILMGVTTRRWLESRRIYFWAGFLGVGFLMGGADLTGMAPIIIAATMIGLFEGTLALLRWTQRG